MKSFTRLSIVFVALLTSTANVFAQSSREQLQQIVEQLQKTPNDNALREKIIQLAAGIKPAPGVPPDARRAFVMAGTYQKDAKKPSDFALAIDSYKEALKLAPWWGDAYYNLSVSLESASRFDEAQAALKLYLLTNPKDADEAQNRIYALDAKKNLAARQVAEASVESVYCQWYATDKVGGTYITVDHGRGSLTYVERDTAGLSKPAIVSRANITETTIAWTQTETFPNQTRSTVVRYSLGRMSGELDYWYTSSTGESRTSRLNCIKTKVQP